MTTPNYATAFAGWSAADYYAGAAGVAPGAVAGFCASALFRVDDFDISAVGTIYIWSNQDPVAARGWSINITPATASLLVTADAYFVAPTPLQSMSVGYTFAGYAQLALVDLMYDPAVGLLLFVNGALGGIIPAPIATPFLPGVGAPLVGVQSDGAGGFQAPAAGVQILGVAYSGASLGASTQALASAAAAHFQACLRANAMAPINLGVNPPTEFTNRWAARTQAPGNGIVAPALWTPAAGASNLTRVGALAIEAPTNSPWL